MSAEENKTLVRRLLERLRGGWTPDVIEEFFAPSYRRYLNPTAPPLAREGQRERANRLRASFPTPPQPSRTSWQTVTASRTVSPYVAPTRASFKGFLRPASAASICSLCANSSRQPAERI
jgi:hypothetical protein